MFGGALERGILVLRNALSCLGKLILFGTEDKYLRIVMKVTNESARFQWLGAQQEVASMADSGQRPAESNLSHSSASVQLIMDYFPDVDLTQPYVISDTLKDMSI